MREKILVDIPWITKRLLFVGKQDGQFCRALVIKRQLGRDHSHPG